METEIKVAEILKDKPQGVKLYSSICGAVELKEVLDVRKKKSIVVKELNSSNQHRFWYDGKFFKAGQCVLQPSKEMADWSKFSWKRGDVLVCKDVNSHIIFDKFNDDTYTTFTGKLNYQATKAGYSYVHTRNIAMTQDFDIEKDDAAQTYINTIEERLRGKLNRETLEVEKPKKKPVFELGNLYVFNEEDEDGEQTIIGKLIGKNESEDTLTFGNQYEIENEKFVTDQAFDLRISIHEELREATEGEAITFQEAYTIWEKSKEQPVFKPFDKVLCRDDIGKEWNIDLFESTVTHNSKYNYKCMANIWKFCIPYAGNENLLGTTKDVEV